MDTLKYQQLIYKQMLEKFKTWSEQEFITEREIYSFLHNLKGTAGTIGLDDFSQIANEKLYLLDETSNNKWIKTEWKAFLSTLIEGIHFYQTNADPMNEDTQLAIPNHTLNQELILVIDDDIIFISYIKRVLEKNGYTVVIAYNEKRGLELIYELKPAIVFLDIMLPDGNGFSILETLKKIKKDRMFVTIISANDCKANHVKAYELGALDFIPKPIDEKILISYVTNRLAFKKELEHSIIIDELTQVYNRKFLESQFEYLIQQYNRNQTPFSVVILDLDYFKKVNDTYGHLVGDEVLKGFAALVMELKREQDIFCRYGGEEFVMLLPQTSVQDAYSLIEIIRQAMVNKDFTANGVNFNVTFSAGLIEANACLLHPKKMLEKADQALYEAKQSGRDRSVIFDNIADVVTKKVNIKIIVIDDVFIIRNMVANYFKNWTINENYEIEVMEFSNGLNFLNSNWYEPNSKYIILLDGLMPKMDGIEVLKKIREKHTSNEVIVSMLTGRKGNEHVVEALKNGANDYIVKPFNITDVSNRIQNLINRMFM
ncbi:diguanylate cyclase [Solibacillus daqui]|uniref:GGDEF domain-containing response regulator n=1 Tax=Solibacillus daqui TaxID=2912187 RepID=UPI00236560B2|nr:diguanylate cyclase [Solibacillus daqui]